MAEQVKGVAVELIIKGTKRFINRYKCRTDIKEKLDRVDMLVLKFRSISEVSDSYEIAGHENLCRWKEKLDEAARQGDDIIRLFKERARQEKSTEDSQSGYSIASVPKNVAKRFKRWFSGDDDDADKLNDVLKRLESVNDEVHDFLKLVKMNQTKSIPFRSRESSAIRRAKRTKTVPGQVYLQAGRIEPVPVLILSHLFGLPRQIANWARMIAVAVTLFCMWLSSKYSNARKIIRVEQLITMMHNRIRDVEHEKNRSPVLAEWLKKMREVTSEGEIALHFLKSRKGGLKDSANQHTVCLGSLLSVLENASKDTEDIWEVLTVARGQFAYMPYCNGVQD